MVKYVGIADLDPLEIAEDLGATYALDGAYVLIQDKILVNARLLSVLTGDILWSGQFYAVGDDLIDLTDGVAKQIVEGVRQGIGRNQKDI